jgi:hypothetical protein
MFACIGTFYQGWMNRRSWEAAQNTLNQMKQDASVSSQQFQVQLSHFDAGLGRTELLATHAGEQAVASKDAADAAKSAANTAKDTLHISERAWVFATAYFIPQEPDTANPTIKIRVQIENLGHTPAIKTLMFTSPGVFQLGGIPPVGNLTQVSTKLPGILNPGATPYTLYAESLTIPERILREYVAGLSFIFIKTRVEYWDVFKHHHWLYICASRMHADPPNKWDVIEIHTDDEDQK